MVQGVNRTSGRSVGRVASLASGALCAVLLVVSANPTVGAAPGNSAAAPLSSEAASALQSPIDSAAAGQATALTLRLPPRVAAVEGRVLLDASAELVGVAPLGDGQTLTPVAVEGGYAFAAYGLGTVLGQTVLRLVVAGNVEGLVSARVL